MGALSSRLAQIFSPLPPSRCCCTATPSVGHFSVAGERERERRSTPLKPLKISSPGILSRNEIADDAKWMFRETIPISSRTKDLDRKEDDFIFSIVRARFRGKSFEFSALLLKQSRRAGISASSCMRLRVNTAMRWGGRAESEGRS